MIEDVTPPFQKEFEQWVDKYLGTWARKGWYDRDGVWHYHSRVMTRLFELYKETHGGN